MAGSPSNPVAPGFESPRSRGRWVLVLLGLTIALDLVSLIVLGAQRSLLDRGLGGISLAEWHTSVSRVNRLGVIEQLLYLATIVAFLMWVHRAYLNLARAGAPGLRFTPGWAVGYWFVPVLNIVRSKQILDDLWRATALRDGADGKDRRPLTSFWLCALVVAGLARIVARRHGATIDGLKQMNGLLMVSHIAYIAAAAILYRLVNSVTARQEGRSEADPIGAAVPSHTG
jgi:hypothetical protein